MLVGAIIQARMGSTRLPGKILMPVLNKPLLEYQLERVKKAKTLDKIMIATTTNIRDQEIVGFCKKKRINYFRGSETDVLSRYYGAAVENEVDIVVRLTSDCPLIDPAVIDKVVGFYLNNKDQYDYVSNILVRTYPRGMDTEVIPFHVLKETYLKAQAKQEREHVTPYIYQHPERFLLGNVLYSKDYSHYRWTVDTIEDYTLIEKIIVSLYPHKKNFALEDCLELIKANQEWEKINSHIEQKVL